MPEPLVSKTVHRIRFSDLHPYHHMRNEVRDVRRRRAACNDGWEGRHYLDLDPRLYRRGGEVVGESAGSHPVGTCLYEWVHEAAAGPSPG
jgi:hypothetical protein